LETSGKTVDDIGAFVLHQANQRILDKAAKDFGIPYDKLVSTLEYTGNTSSASVPIAFEKALEAKMIKRGDLVIMVGFGGGLTWGGVLVEY
jgi:3-oxoacyl-[acyl-carrier-protein] synthase-3